MIHSTHSKIYTLVFNKLTGDLNVDVAHVMINIVEVQMCKWS